MRVFEGVASPDVIRAALDHTLLDEVNVTSDDRRELVPHFDQLEQCPWRGLVECHEEIDIAVISKLTGL